MIIGHAVSPSSIQVMVQIIINPMNLHETFYNSPLVMNYHFAIFMHFFKEKPSHRDISSVIGCRDQLKMDENFNSLSLDIT